METTDVSAVSTSRSIGLKLRKKTYSLPNASAYSPPTEEIYAYFDSRKISKETVDAFGILSDANGDIVFPFYENDILTYVKYRHPCKHEKGSNTPKEWAEKNTKAILFGLHMASYSQPLIITEGELDCMSLYEAGFYNVVSVPAGAQNEQWIDNCRDELEKFPSFILFGDGDAPGQAAVNSWAHRLEEGRCSIVVDYPERPDSNVIAKDANEILFFFGKEKLMEMVQNAEFVEMSGLVDLSMVSSFNPTVADMCPSSFYTVNYEIGGYSPGDLVCWTGKTGDGKSTVLSQEILQAVESGRNVVWYTAELAPIKLKRSLLMQAAGSDYIGLEYDPRRDRELQVLSPTVISRINDWLAGRIMLCTDNVSTMEFDTNYLLELLRYARRRNGCTVAVVDNIMTAVMGADDETYYRAQEKFTLELKKIATSLDMVVHLCAHPRKTRDSLTNDDVAGTASITRLSDTVMAVKHGEIKVLKDRNEGNANVSTKFVYYPDCRLCADIADRGGQPHFSWDREGVVMPERKACTVYGRQMPTMEDYPI